jgi:hypothetical protein
LGSDFTLGIIINVPNNKIIKTNMTKSKSQVLKEEYTKLFGFDGPPWDIDGKSYDRIWAWIELQLTQQKAETIKEIQEYWFDLVVGPKGLRSMCDHFSSYLSKLK